MVLRLLPAVSGLKAYNQLQLPENSKDRIIICNLWEKLFRMLHLFDKTSTRKEGKPQ